MRPRAAATISIRSVDMQIMDILNGPTRRSNPLPVRVRSPGQMSQMWWARTYPPVSVYRSNLQVLARNIKLRNFFFLITSAVLSVLGVLSIQSGVPL